MIKIRIDEAYRFVRSDERGAFAREKRDAFYADLKNLQDFVDSCIDKGS